ncbi:MAG: 23S rRNA (cytosine1962-C5)-methyltransferase [Verrucomicrobiales bacterium]|jgi:23S rRNA (cytosine1962-C5)-methyltransferase
MNARLKIRLTPAAERAARDGHPWIYADRIKTINRDGEAGELAVVYDRRDRFFGVGLFDPHSPIRLRMLHVGSQVTIDDAWWLARFRTATEIRKGMFDDRTTGYRWINGESDGLPALVVDRYADVAVVKIYSSIWLPRLEEVLGWIRGACDPQPQAIVLRLSRNIAELAESSFGLKDGDVVFGEVVAPVVFKENGKRFEADVLKGQKTGFFLDQRENRQRVAEFSEGKDVLNVFSHSGGFSIYAAVAGARSTTDVDISAHALEEAKRNMALNEAGRCRHETVKADAFAWLEEGPEMFDVVIIDPPSLARRQTEKIGALAGYRRLVRAGVKRLRPGGILLAASCSAHVSSADFFRIVREIMVRVGADEIETRLHAPDHAARIPEAHYLKAIYYRL